MKWKIVFVIVALLVPMSTITAQKKAKKISLSGYVVDPAGRPVADAMFFLDGVKISSVSKPDGSFKFKVKPGTEVITVYSLLNGGSELEYNGETTMVFELSESILVPGQGKPDEAAETVNIGYENTRKEDLSTSVGSVNKNKLEKTHYTSIYQMIAGEVPGVVVTGSSIRVRGTSSINSGNEPIFVVDGTVLTTIDNINPNDVESIDILKGGSTAIYGARGANGVIIIKLKGYKK